MPSPILKRDMYVVRIDLPTSTAPSPSQPSQYPSPAPTASSSSDPPPPFSGRHQGLTFLAHSPLRQPVFIGAAFISASGHAGILGDIPDTMVVFVLLFDPLTPSSSLNPTRCASSLVHCGFKCTPGTRYTALATATHVLLYAESGAKTLARRINVRPMRRRWTATSSSAAAECVDLGIKHLGTPRSRTFVGSPGTEGAPFFTTVRATLRKSTPGWLRREGSADGRTRPEGKPGRGGVKKRSRQERITVCAMGLSVDVDQRSTDVFRGMALGAHDIEPDSESDESESELDESSTSWGPRLRPTSVRPGRCNTRSTLPDSYSLPTPSQSSLIEQPDPAPTPANETKAPTPLPLHRPFRRVCRVRYKRTIFPTHVNYAHELAGIGSFGRYAAWIEGDGVPEQVDWAKESLRVVVAPLTWESGSETYDGQDEKAMRDQAGERARVVDVPEGMRDKLNLVSCVAMEDGCGVLAMATINGQVFVGSLVA
jgi:hypothetical protein